MEVKIFLIGLIVKQSKKGCQRTPSPLTPIDTKKLLNEMKLELPETPDITDIGKFTIKRDEKILEKIIKPKDDLIKELYHENLSLNKELSKQSKVVDEAVKYQKERDKILADNEELHNTVKNLEHKYKIKSNNLDFDFNKRKKELEEEFEKNLII